MFGEELYQNQKQTSLFLDFFLPSPKDSWEHHKASGISLSFGVSTELQFGLRTQDKI